MLWTLFFFVVSSASLVKSQGLTIAGVKCGEKYCKLLEYCSDFDRICEPCKDICNETNHNFNKIICESKCQNFIHDTMYVSKKGSGSGNEDLRDTVDKLSRLTSVTLALVCFMLVVLALYLCFQIYRWKEKKNITFASIKDKILGKTSGEETTNNVAESSFKKGGDLRLDITSNVTQSDHSPVTLSTSIGRRPAEDSTLDYAYDNHAMTPASR